MKYRHEWKHEINYADVITLRMKLSAIMQIDHHAIDNKYEIRSLYFDTPTDKALREKVDGVNLREKFRIRLYNRDTSYISLEKKSKINGLCAKQSCIISKEEAKRIVNNDIEWLIKKEDALCQELYSKMKSQLLAPKTIVDYTREPYIFKAGNVRVTIDSDIRTGEFRTDFLDAKTITMPAGDSPIILEVKWDEFLPDIIRDAVFIKGRHVSAFSKYEQCRIFG